MSFVRLHDLIASLWVRFRGLKPKIGARLIGCKLNSAGAFLSKMSAVCLLHPAATGAPTRAISSPQRMIPPSITLAKTPSRGMMQSPAW